MSHGHILSRRSLFGEGRWASVTFLPYLGQNALFPVLRSHLQLILEVVTVLGVASTLSAIPDPGARQWFTLFSQHSQCGVLGLARPHGASPALLPVTWPVFQEHLCPLQLLNLCQPTAPHILVQHPQGTRSLPAWENVTELGPGGPAAARFLSRKDRLCPDSNPWLGRWHQPAVRALYVPSLAPPCGILPGSEGAESCGHHLGAAASSPDTPLACPAHQLKMSLNSIVTATRACSSV